MPRRKIKLKSSEVLPEGAIERQIRDAPDRELWLDGRFYDRVIDGRAVDVFAPDGSLLLMYRPGILPVEACELALPAMRKLGSSYTDIRGFHTGVAGTFTKSDGVPYMTTFMRTQRVLFSQCRDLLRCLDHTFMEECPERYEAQRRVADQTNRDYLLWDTCFTTVTSNRWTGDGKFDAQTYAHTDSANLHEGFGVITVLSTDNYTGGLTVFPSWRVAVDLRTTDVLLFNPHELHGNTALEGKHDCERVAVVPYYRSSIWQYTKRLKWQ